MYSGLFLGLLALVAIIPLHDAVSVSVDPPTIVGCSKKTDCSSIGVIPQTCCLPKVPNTPVSSLVSVPTMPSLCAPTESACCTNDTQCPTVAAEGQTVINKYCCQSLRICVADSVACNGLMCDANTPCKDTTKTCCIPPVSVSAAGTTTPASGVCLTNGIATIACNM